MPSSNKLIIRQCDTCNQSYNIKYSTFLERQRRNYPSICPKCTSLKKSNSIKKYYKDRPDEIKKQSSKKKSASLLKYWDNVDETVRSKRSKAISDSIKHLSHEEMMNRMSKISNGNKLYWDSLTKEKREILKDQRMKMLTRHLDMMKNDPSYNKMISSKISSGQKVYWDSKDKDERYTILQNLFDGHTQWLQNMSPDEYQSWRNNILEYWRSLSKEEHALLSDRMSQTSITYWKSLSDTDKNDRIKKLILSSGGHNNLHAKFEKQFSESYMSNKFYYVPEVMMGTEFSHSWDYGIYDRANNTLIMLIDLDGVYYHADNCDYTGIRSHEEYDERRFQTVPDGIIYHIIMEEKFIKSFTEMIRLLTIDYNQFINDQVTLCRNMEFPYPYYSDNELTKSWNQLLKLDPDNKSLKLSTCNREGDRLIQHFHPSIYHAHRYKCLSPYEAWHDDQLLIKVIENRIIYVNKLNPNKILQGFNISKIAPKVSVFSAGRAKVLIHKYLNDCDEIFDPFSGFSGRMLGTVSLGKHYIGQDISDYHVNESKKMIQFLDISRFVNIYDKDIMSSSGEYESLFTCPPYDDKEFWMRVSSKIQSCDDWIDECLKRFKCKKYLFVVDNSERYVNNIVDKITNRSHFNKNLEYVILIERD